VELGSDEGEATIEGMILVDLRTELGSKKTKIASDTGQFRCRDAAEPIIPCVSCLLQRDTMSVVVEAFIQIAIQRNQIRVVLVQLFDDLLSDT